MKRSVESQSLNSYGMLSDASFGDLPRSRQFRQQPNQPKQCKDMLSCKASASWGWAT